MYHISTDEGSNTLKTLHGEDRNKLENRSDINNNDSDRILINPGYPVYRIQDTVHCIQDTVNSIQYTVYSI